jgi:uridine kinase
VSAALAWRTPDGRHVGVDDVAAAVRAAPARAGRTRVTAVDGPSGAGKTTLATALAAALGGAPVVHMDDLYPGWDGLAAAVPRLVEQVLDPLRAGLPAAYRRYDWVAGRYAEEHPVPAAEHLVVEGVASGSVPCAPALALIVWVEAPRPLRFARGIERDGEAFRPHWERWAVQEERHFAAHRTRERADLVLDGGGGAAGG